MLGERLKYLRKSLGLTQEELAQKLGISMMTLRRYESNKSQPDAEVLTKLLKLFHVNLNWLLTGKGNMFINNEHNIPVPSPIDRELFQRITELIEGYYKAGLLNGVPEEEIIEMVKFLYKKVKPIKDREEADWREELNKLGKNYAKIFLT
ncbi:Helix-turn-helix [Balnearium lithotrophicum]|uniref:Helix-turn-helix n=1 Tax=Balnearium lithotrophicum TaxID=223788 RepID=A0A521DT31_9BACT|nr:helix-turn-helix transcriptional regulator [Balnearium lithotrophicum]SMO74869.1 Helix-turn-helix [Balnearium lithotrophicum]